MRQSAVEQLLGRLYGSDLGERGFVPFLEEIGRTMRAHVISLQGHDLEHQRGRLEVLVGLGPEWLDIYERASSENLWFARSGEQLISRGIADDEGLATEAELRTTRFHNDFMLPTGIGHGMALCLNSGPQGQIAVLTINRERRCGFFRPDERQLAQALLPHLRNVYTLHQRLSWMKTEERAFRAALDQLNEGVLMFAGNGTVLFANEQAQVIEAEGVFVRQRQGLISAVFRADEAALRDALSRVLSVSSLGKVTLGLHDQGGHLAGTITLCPTPLMCTNLWSESDVRALAFLRPLAAPGKPDLAALRTILHLTPAETRLAYALMQGASLDQAAAQFHVTRNTIRSQLSSLFARTDTRRQSELLRVLLRLV
jgi:DNA-binding CsgD family transcriptional regulator/PAS domain-containing protein